MRYFLGWDVGAWNCNKRSKSQDALAVLADNDGLLALQGKVFRGPLRTEIAEVATVASLLKAHCGIETQPNDTFYIGIDTPLGLPEAVQWHVNMSSLPEKVESRASHNPYLYRKTEQLLAEKQFPPLSAIKDMIGSQFTKGLHFLRKLNLERQSEPVGVWASGNVTALEVYPATCKPTDTKGYVCRGSEFVQSLFSNVQGAKELPTSDEQDAVYCALIAYLFATARERLVTPPADIPVSEGWIWYPKDSIGRSTKKKKAT